MSEGLRQRSWPWRQTPLAGGGGVRGKAEKVGKGHSRWDLVRILKEILSGVGAPERPDFPWDSEWRCSGHNRSIQVRSVAPGGRLRLSKRC